MWGCLCVVGYRLGGVSGKGRHMDVCVRERDKDKVDGGSLMVWGDLWMCVYVGEREREEGTC